MALLVDKDMPEYLFQREIVRLAEELGWLIHYDIPSYRRGMLRTQSGGNNGYPDLTLARNGVIHFWECKATKGTVSKDQQAWLLALGGRVVRPADKEWIEGALA